MDRSIDDVCMHTHAHTHTVVVLVVDDDYGDDDVNDDGGILENASVWCKKLHM